MQIAIVFADFLWRAGVGYKIGNDAHMFEGFIWGGWRGQVTTLNRLMPIIKYSVGNVLNRSGALRYIFRKAFGSLPRGTVTAGD